MQTVLPFAHDGGHAGVSSKLAHLTLRNKCHLHSRACTFLIRPGLKFCSKCLEGQKSTLFALTKWKAKIEKRKLSLNYLLPSFPKLYMTADETWKRKVHDEELKAVADKKRKIEVHRVACSVEIQKQMSDVKHMLEEILKHEGEPLPTAVCEALGISVLQMKDLVSNISKYEEHLQPWNKYQDGYDPGVLARCRIIRNKVGRTNWEFLRKTGVLKDDHAPSNSLLDAAKKVSSSVPGNDLKL